MTSGIEPRGKSVGPLMIGGLLIALGLLFLAAQFLDLNFSIGSILWPFFVIVPGLLIFAFAFVRGDTGEPFASVGSVVVMLGLLLLYQNSSGHWENWAYSWALLVPTAIGLGKIVFGALTQQTTLVKQGVRLAIIGSVIFLVGYFFFELVSGIGGRGLRYYGLARYGWPLLMIFVGLAVVLSNLLSGRTSPQQK